MLVIIIVLRCLWPFCSDVMLCCLFVCLLLPLFTVAFYLLAVCLLFAFIFVVCLLLPFTCRLLLVVVVADVWSCRCLLLDA